MTAELIFIGMDLLEQKRPRTAAGIWLKSVNDLDFLSMG